MTEGPKNREFWRQQVEKFKASGLSQAAFSREHHFNPKTFGGWVGRIDRKVETKRKRSRAKTGVKKGEKSRARVENWRRHVEAYKASGESQESYGRKHGFSGAALSYWVTRFKEDPKEKASKLRRFVAVKVAPSVPAPGPQTQSPTVRVALPDGTVIETCGGDLATVAALTNLLRGRTS